MEIVVVQATPFRPNWYLFLMFASWLRRLYSFGKSRAEFENLESPSVARPNCRRIRGCSVISAAETGIGVEAEANTGGSIRRRTASL
jgi:hypothetical protein